MSDLLPQPMTADPRGTLASITFGPRDIDILRRIADDLREVYGRNVDGAADLDSIADRIEALRDRQREPQIGDTRPCRLCGEPETLLRPYDPERRTFSMVWNCYNPDCPPGPAGA